MKRFGLKELLGTADVEQIRGAISNYPAFEGRFFEGITSGSIYHYTSGGSIKKLKRGSVIGYIKFSRPYINSLSESLEYQPAVVAPEDGYYYIPKPENNSIVFLLEQDIVICDLFESDEETVRFYVENGCKYSIKEDPFTNTKQIVWSQSFGLDFKGGGSRFYIVLQNSKEQMVLEYHRKDFSIHKFRKNDSFHFLFCNGVRLEYLLKAGPTNTNNSDYKQVSFPLLTQDINLFATEYVTAIRCSFANGDAPLDLHPENELALLALKLYFQKYKQALKECGVDIETQPLDKTTDENEEMEMPTWKDGSCFVYLMKDESNGFYKIGISNKPEYRERTLQSEKPTIVLLKAKEFPTRTIAEAIESALHKAYGNKRLRGEWFDLDPKDVSDIVNTLS